MALPQNSVEVSSVACCWQYHPCGGGPVSYRFPLSSLSQSGVTYRNSWDICHHIAFRGVSRCTLCVETHKSFRRSHIWSSRRGESTPTSMITEHSMIVWTIESDLAADQHLYITGDSSVLGCWKPKTAVIMLPTESSNLWKAEMEIACGTTLKYNYFIKGKSGTASDIIWRPGPELTLSVPLCGQFDTEITVRDSWIRSDSSMSSATAWDLLVEETYLFLHPCFPDSRTDEEKVAKRTESNITKPKPNMVREKLHVNDNNRNNAVNENSNSAKIFPEEYQPVEEPWLHRSPLASTSMDETEGGVPQKGEVRLEQSNKDETNQIKDSVSTVILINSSICTMQRIAVLEDGKLVELLLEPVKSEVHCDSVYIGVVTKLVPNMGSAFVNIGLGRPSLMSIDHSREPFVFPPFTQTKRQDTKDSYSRPIDGNLVAANNESPHDIEVVDEVIHSHNGSVQSKNNNHDQQGGDDDFDMPHILDQDVNGSTVDEGDLDVDFEDDLDGSEVHPTGTNCSINFKYLQIQDMKGPNHDSTGVKWNQVSRGTKIIVQVRKEGLGTKGPTLTAYPKLRSRFWILMTRCNRIGISQKILGAERTRLKVIANTLQPQGFGLTVRTVATGHSLEELQRDLDGLLSTWKNIIEQAKSASLAADEGVKGAVPIILHRAMGQTLSVVQDYFNDKVQKMVVDSRRTYHEVTSYLQEMAPDLCDRVELYDKRIPLFDELKIEEEIDNMLSKKVPLVNGGSLVIEQTEALVSIDVNAGTGVFGHGTSQEKTTLDVNLAAAKQIARELRLRDIGGIIVVDFIDMTDESNKRLIYEEVKKAVARDRSALRISELSRNGLMEITRKRFRPSVTFMISDPCNCCHATGRVEALETSFSKIEKQICRFLSLMDQRTYPENPKSWPKFILNVDHHMCQYLTSGKNSRLAMLSSSLKVWILLKVARGFTRGTFEVKPSTDGKSENNLDQFPIANLQTTVAKSGAAIPKMNVFPAKRSKAGKRYKVK